MQNWTHCSWIVAVKARTITNKRYANEKHFVPSSGARRFSRFGNDTLRLTDLLLFSLMTYAILRTERINISMASWTLKHIFSANSLQAYVNAVNSGSENVEKILLSPESRQQLVALGPKLIKQTVNKHKTIDTEDTELKCIRQSDGTLVTEKKKTTEHEDILDEDLPDGDNRSSGSREKILKHKVSLKRENCLMNFRFTTRTFIRNHRNASRSSVTSKKLNMCLMVRS